MVAESSLEGLVSLRQLQKNYQAANDTSVREHYLKVANQLAAEWDGRRGLFPDQRKVLLDDAERKLIMTPRQSGKSWTLKILPLINCLVFDNYHAMYINTSSKECKRVLWNGRDGLVALNTDLNLGAKINTQHLTMEFRNGAVIELMGIDDTLEMEKARGGSYNLVEIDEAGKFPDLEYFVQEVIQGSQIARENIQLVLAGTPPASCSGFFVDQIKRWRAHAGTDKAKVGWSYHNWGIKQNLAAPNAWPTALRIKESNGWDDNHPSWRREFKGELVRSEDLAMYPSLVRDEEDGLYHEFDWAGPQSEWPGLVDAQGKPVTDSKGKQKRVEWNFAAGIDTGYRNFAISIWAYSFDHPTAYEVETLVLQGFDAEDQLEFLEEKLEEWGILFGSIDAGDGIAAVVKAWMEKRNLPLGLANKKDKSGYIQLLDAAIAKGKFKFNRAEEKKRELEPNIYAGGLLNEMKLLEWNERYLKRGAFQEDRRRKLDNHRADAFLYLSKDLIDWAWEEQSSDPLPETAQWWKQEEERLREEELMRISKEPDSFYEAFEQLRER